LTDTAATSYRRLNRTLFWLTLGLSILPLVMIPAAPYLPWPVSRCFSLRFLGRPCPMCGLTRGLYLLARSRLAEAGDCSPLAFPAAVLLGAELLYRAGAAAVQLPARYAAAVARADVVVHAGLAACYLVYASVFWMYSL
jgi:hypothetical protein